MRKIIFVMTVVFFASCGNELDIKPTTSVDAETAKKSVNLLLTGAYSLIGSGGVAAQTGALYGTDLLLNADLLASENYMTWKGTFNQYNEISKKAISPTNSSVTRMWRKGYAAINLANTILESLGNAKESDRSYYRGQALFIRGIMHFELMRFWAEPSTGLAVPLMTKAVQDFSEIQLPARATIGDIYTAVIADLTEAKTLLASSENLANNYTVSAFLARVYLQKGDYANALAEANNVIQNGGYELPASVEEAFNGTSSETIFEIEQTVINNAGTSNDGLTTFYSCDPNTPGSSGRGDVGILPAFISRYEPTDKRLEFLIYEGSCNKGSVTSAKWKDPYANIPIVRLSEMYLIRAEANQRLGSTIGETPVNDVNAIREKAGASLYGTITLDNILNERELELAFEGQRIHDYKRLGKVIGSTDYKGAKFIFPIPQTEINTNPNLTQNTYYH